MHPLINLTPDHIHTHPFSSDIRAYSQVNLFNNEKILCGITSVDFSKTGRILFAGYDDYNWYGWDVLKKGEGAQAAYQEVS